eukprot:5211661-Prorocentrum_lima.AAC.1
MLVPKPTNLVVWEHYYCLLATAGGSAPPFACQHECGSMWDRQRRAAAKRDGDLPMDPEGAEEG